MLRIDFNQRFLDHRCILVFVKKLGAIAESEFSQLFDDISQLRTVELPNGRTVHLRYTRHISHQFIEWGSFHMHKKLLGILSVAKMLDEDVSAIKTAHESLKTWYGNTALHSRCFVLGCENITEDKRDREFVFLNQDNVMKEIEAQVADYALSLFLVLEGKRMDKSLEKPDKFAFLRSPLDGEISADVDSRNRKQCIGRMKKYIGDLCLVTGVPEEAIFHYTVAIDFLRSVGDVLWTSGSLEGLCAASLLCRAEHKITSSERPSLQLDISQLSTAGPVNGTGADGDEYKIVIPLTDVEIVEKSEEIFQIYEKHRESKVLSIEARFKYARFFLSKKRHRDVSTALQDVLATELTFKLSDAEKIQLYSAMAIMYEDIGYMRKAAFFTRKAARHCTSQHLPPQGWTASYNLMRNALDGYKIHFDNNRMTTEQENTEGWPDLKVQLMKELIEMSKELQNTNIPIRHISYLLQTMHPHIKESDMQDLINSLEKLASTSQQGQFSLVDDLLLSNNDVLPPVSLTELPIVRAMKVNVLASHLRPIVSPSSPSPVKTPFIFSTLNKGPRKSKKANPAIRWVEGDVGEVAMQVHNPMPFDIKISKMTLLTEGVPFQAFPSCLALSNDNMSHPFMLLGIPEGPGQLVITGYSVELFGIQSSCSITETILDKQFSLPLIVNVTPKLPLVQFQSGINDVKSFVNSSHRGSSLTLEVKIYRGQSISGPIVVENVSNIPVEALTIALLSTFKTDTMNLVTLDQDHVTESLPLQPGATSHFNLTFHGILSESLQDGGTLNWSGKLKISYSGGEAWKLGTSRHAAVDIRIEVISSLHSVDYAVVSVEKGDGEHFEICMDVYNQTNYDVEWRFQMNTGIAYPNETNILPADHSIRTTLELEKFDLSGFDPKRTECDVCTEKLLDLVKLRWQIPELEIFGILNLDGLKLTEGMINVVRRSRFTFEMSVNGEKLKRGDCVSSTASKPIFLTVTVFNSSDKEVSSSILNIEPFEVDEMGVENFDVKQKICWLGATSTLLPEIQAKSTAEHTCALLFLSSGQFYINVKCFERVNTDIDQPFRGRAHVIKESPSNRRSRSSRTDSFTDSLLLRQRSQSTPVAQFIYSLLFEVREDPNTIIDDVDSGVDPRVSGKDHHIPEKDSSIPEKDSSVQKKGPCVLNKITQDPGEQNNLDKLDDLKNVDCDVEGEIDTTGVNVSLKEVMVALESNNCEEVHVVLGDNKREEGVTCSDGMGNLEVKMDDKEGKDHQELYSEDTSKENKVSIQSDRQEIPNTLENIGEDIGEHSKDQESVASIGETVIPADGLSQYRESSIDVQTTQCSKESADQCTVMPLDDLCLKVQDIKLDFTDRENNSGEGKGSNASKDLVFETKPKVKEKVRVKENRKSNQTSNEDWTKPEVTQASEANVEGSGISNYDQSDEPALRSPSIKDRIMFFNSS